MAAQEEKDIKEIAELIIKELPGQYKSVVATGTKHDL